METLTFTEQGSSFNTFSGQQQIGLSKWDPKHKIFLSHSGKQKEFVRQLCKDLEAETHQPFFDERSSSLTKGEPFVPQIFEAARHCLVAVVVLSEDFFTSKWPMIELLEFVKAKKFHNKALKLFPLFYKLTPSDLKSESNVNRWKSVWAKITTTVTPIHGMAPDDTSQRLNLSLCKEALQVLCSSNGLKFQGFPSKVAYREAIVKEISFLVAPDLLNDTSDVVGNERLCKVFADMFVEDESEDSNLWGTHKLGLYGVGGLGKTTMSRALCNFFYEEFCGRVFHVEMGSKPPEDLQKLVLTKLLRLNKDLVDKVHNVHEGRKLLKDHMNRQPIFLVLDNVASDVESKTEALAYLEARFHPKSKIMITARSRDIVEELFPKGPNSTYCKAMASLTEQEAGFIFLRRAAPHRQLETLTIEEQEILKKCLAQCHFSSEGRESHYHPMALLALGDYYHRHNFHVLKWKEHLEDLHKLRLSNASSDIFAVLGLQFSTFGVKKKLLFLDVALYSRGALHKLWMNYNECLRWLADIHEDTPTAMEFQLQTLKRLGIINLIPVEVTYSDPLLEVTTHDLYKEFAEWYVTDGEGSSCTELGCVYHTIPTNSLPYVLKKTSPSTSQLQRIWLENLKCVTFPSQKVQEWCNVVVLHIHGCSNLKVLHLHGLSCLRHLELGWLENLETFYFSETVLTETSNGTPESLQYVVLDELLSLRQLPNFSLCTLLKSFEMVECLGFLMEPPSFKDCSQLEVLHLEWNWQWQTEVYKLNTLTSLTSLYILGSTLDEGYNFNVKEKCKPESEFEPESDVKLDGLQACVLLQNLSLFHLPITSLPGLEKLTKLRVLSIEDCGFLGDIPDVSALAHLESLCISRAMIKQIPGVKKLLQLQRLDCWGCEELTTVPDLDHLPRLTFLSTQYCSSLQDNPRVPLHCEYIQDRRVIMPEHFFEPDTYFETIFEPDTSFEPYPFFRT